MSRVRLRATGRDDYVAFCEGVRSLADVDLLQYKRAQMERRIRALARRRGVHALGDYLALLGEHAEELERFLDRMTINVSQLWRNPEQWQLLARTVLPELARCGQLRAWSAGCSNGAEIYTLAAVATDGMPGCRLELLGTDIDARMVERARRGWFSNDDARHADRAALTRWFVPDGDGWRARPELFEVTRFEVADLLALSPSPAAYDLVLCRNVVIYLTPDGRDDLHARLAASLRSGGYLLVGSTERVSRPAEIGLEPAHPFLYRKA